MSIEIHSPRYARQLGLPELGEAGQRRLASASVLVVGAGGLGSPLLYALAGAGVGRLRIVDGDTVSESNLNRQFLYTPADLGRGKAEAAAERLRAFAPELELEACPCVLDGENGPDLLQDMELVVSAVDDIPTRLTLNRLCARQRLPLVNGGVEGFAGLVMAVEPGHGGPCLECLYGGRPEASPPGPVLGAVSAAVGTLMAQVVLRFLLEGKNPIPGELLLYDGWNLTLEHIPLERAACCPVCGEHKR